jgi:hypothetical protein
MKKKIFFPGTFHLSLVVRVCSRFPGAYLALGEFFFFFPNGKKKIKNKKFTTLAKKKKKEITKTK